MPSITASVKATVKAKLGEYLTAADGAILPGVGGPVLKPTFRRCRR
jgi:hypothetical protein